MIKKKNILITGAAGFIGSALSRKISTFKNVNICLIDNLSYAGSIRNIKIIKKLPNVHFKKIDISIRKELKNLLTTFKPNLIFHLAAESHVDRSISNPKKFINTNIIGTYNLLEELRNYYKKDPNFRFIHISTDEVYGDLPLKREKNDSFKETSQYNPNSPYSSSKASSDHLVNAWFKTFNLPTIITNCSNNYGPFQYPEKLIPLITINALNGKKLPVYGNGKNIRDWIYVDDHIDALIKVAKNGLIGEKYNIGGLNEITNIEIVNLICEFLDIIFPTTRNSLVNNNLKSYKSLISFVNDRPGHDKRYSVDISKIQKELNWKPKTNFNYGLKKTIEWYVKNHKLL